MFVLRDIAGQERFCGLSRIFYTHAVAAIVVYDVCAKYVAAQISIQNQHHLNPTVLLSASIIHLISFLQIHRYFSGILSTMP